MLSLDSQWQAISAILPPDWLIAAVQEVAPDTAGRYAAQLLWQRGIHQPDQVAGFLDPNKYQPTSPFAFGVEMEWAVERLQRARDRNQNVAIWGDFDADGITATAVLWEGLGQFFSQGDQLTYTIPNRITESHGLHRAGLERLAQAGYNLIVTCDTGSTNGPEIAYAQSLGLDVIVTDHHSLLPSRPPVTALINPRNLSPDHPLAHLSGVAVAYKLVEALYAKLPEVPRQPLEHLLDLVAIGLIADLVELKGDCRYLAQRGIERLQQQLTLRTRPGVAKLLELCKRTGDRPMDISFGLGPRINAVSRIHGDASFCVELLTSLDPVRCQQLAQETELANTRRQGLQKDVLQQAIAQLDYLDLSTTPVILLSDRQWPVGVLGLVAGQIAQTYGRPTLLLSEDQLGQVDQQALARGSARSVNNINLYELVASQADLLTSFGGHPLAAGFSLPVENIPWLRDALNQKARQLPGGLSAPTLPVDLEITLAQLAAEGGRELFRELKLLEPCGMGNPTPQLLIRQVRFGRIRHQNLRDRTRRKVKYIKTTFRLEDDATPQGFPGVWWGHYAEEIPPETCDVIVELDFNSRETQYEVRLVALRLNGNSAQPHQQPEPRQLNIVDWRPPVALPSLSPDHLVVQQCPSSWADLQDWVQQAQRSGKMLAIAFAPQPSSLGIDRWRQLVGIAKYLSRTGETPSLSQLQVQLQLGRRSLQMGLASLEDLGFVVQVQDDQIQIDRQDFAPSLSPEKRSQSMRTFLQAVAEEQFQQNYFQSVPLEVMQAIALNPLS